MFSVSELAHKKISCIQIMPFFYDVQKIKQPRPQYLFFGFGPHPKGKRKGLGTRLKIKNKSVNGCNLQLVQMSRFRLLYSWLLAS